MKNWRIYFGLLIVIVVLSLISGCQSDNLASNIVYQYSGSVGRGDFIEVDLNLTQQTYNYTNLITNETGSGTFTEVNNNFYQITDGDPLLAGQHFTILDDQILLASINGEPGQQLIATLKRADSAYGEEIGGVYNVATSLEGWVGEMTIDPSSSTLDVSLDTDSDGIYDEIFNGLVYSFEQNLKAIKIIESESFRHYGVFINNDVGIFDCYMWDGGAWVGDGMFFLVRQDSTINIADYAGQYTYFDVDADYGVFELIEEGVELKFIVDGEDTGIRFTNDQINNGVITFSGDLADLGVAQTWNFVFLPGQVIIAACSHPQAFGGEEGGFAVGIRN